MVINQNREVMRCILSTCSLCSILPDKSSSTPLTVSWLFWLLSVVVCLRLKTKAERKIYAGCAKATNHYLKQVSGLKVRRPPSTLLSPTGWQHRRPRPEEPNKAEAVDRKQFLRKQYNESFRDGWDSRGEHESGLLEGGKIVIIQPLLTSHKHFI